MPTGEWMRFAALEYIRQLADYRDRFLADMAALDEARARAEAVGAIRYDRDGSPAGWRDHLPEILDTMAAIHERMRQRYEAEEADYQAAIGGFNADPRKRLAWSKWGEHRTWAEIAQAERISKATARRWGADGLERIYYQMPAEYRRVHVNAEEWER